MNGIQLPVHDTAFYEVIEERKRAGGGRERRRKNEPMKMQKNRI